MSSSEFAYWQQVYELEPLGHERDYYLAAKRDATVINWSGKTLKKEHWRSVQDEMPFKNETPVEDKTDEQIADEIRLAMNAYMARQQMTAA